MKAQINLITIWTNDIDKMNKIIITSFILIVIAIFIYLNNTGKKRISTSSDIAIAVLLGTSVIMLMIVETNNF